MDTPKYRWQLEAPEPVSDDEIGEALIAARGNVTEAAKTVNRRPQTLRNRIKASAELQALKAELLEQLLDTAESNVHNEVFSGDASASWRILNTLGKNRGYVSREIVPPFKPQPLTTMEVDDAEL